MPGSPDSGRFAYREAMVLAVLGVVLAAIAGLLKLLSSHGSWIIPLLIVAVILIGAEVAWGWHRTGMYRRAA